MLTNWNIDYSSFIKKKSVSLLIPFIIYSIINILVYPIYGNESLKDYTEGIVCNGWGGIALWFIPVLWISLIICDFTKNSRISILLFAVLGFLLSFEKIILPWAISTIPIACVYIFLGMYSKRLVYFMIDRTKWLIFLSGIVVVVTSFVSHYWRLDLASNQILPFFPLVIGSLFGIVGILCISKLIEIYAHPYIKKAFILTGRNTLEVLALSQCIILILNVFIPELLWIRYLILIFIIIAVVKIKKVGNSWMKIMIYNICKFIQKR